MNYVDQPRRTQAVRVAAWSRLAVLLLIASMLVVLMRVAQLKMAPEPRLAARTEPRLSSRTELARRGELLDVRGRLLATSTIGYRLFVDPTAVDDPQTIAVDLAGAIGADPVEIDRRILASSSPRYAVIAQELEPWQVRAVRQAGLRGVGLEPRLVRRYPGGDLAASIVGLVGFEHHGLSGGEYAFERRLAEKPGRLAWLADARQRALWIEPHHHVPADDGDSVRLSVDMAVQEMASRRLGEAVERYEAAGGRVVVLDCRSGELLALVDLLAHRPGREPLIEDPGRAISPSLARNRCVTDPYEPGSTLKPFVWAAATELGLAEPDEILPTPAGGPWRTRYGRWIRDSHYHGPLSWHDVLVHSLNTGMAMVAERMTHEQMRQALARFGFGERTRCGVPGETTGLVTPPGRWNDYTQSSVSFGHEIGVTPVQMVRAFAAIARDGTLPPVRITARTEQDGRFRMVRRACSPATAATVRRALHRVMLEGTGRPAASDRYRLFGKSGTAQLPRPEGGGYFEDRYVSSFIAGAPLDDPKIVVLCVIDDPRRSLGHWGGHTAGPVVRDVVVEVLEYLGEPGDVEAAPDELAAAHWD